MKTFLIRVSQAEGAFCSSVRWASSKVNRFTKKKATAASTVTPAPPPTEGSESPAKPTSKGRSKYRRKFDMEMKATAPLARQTPLAPTTAAPLPPPLVAVPAPAPAAPSAEAVHYISPEQFSNIQSGFRSVLQKQKAMRNNYVTLKSSAIVWKSFASLCLSALQDDGSGIYALFPHALQAMRSGETCGVLCVNSESQDCRSDQAGEPKSALRLKLPLQLLKTLCTPVELPFPPSMSELLTSSTADTLTSLSWRREWWKLVSTMEAEDGIHSPTVGLLSPKQCAEIERAFGLRQDGEGTTGGATAPLEDAARSRSVQELFWLLRTISFFRWVTADYQWFSQKGAPPYDAADGNDSTAPQQLLPALEQLLRTMPQQGGLEETALSAVRGIITSRPMCTVTSDASGTPTYTLDVFGFIFSLLLRYSLSNFVHLSGKERGECFRMALAPVWNSDGRFVEALSMWYAGIELECQRLQVDSVHSSGPVALVGSSSADLVAFSKAMRLLCVTSGQWRVCDGLHWSSFEQNLKVLIDRKREMLKAAEEGDEKIVLSDDQTIEKVQLLVFHIYHSLSAAKHALSQTLLRRWFQHLRVLSKKFATAIPSIDCANLSTRVPKCLYDTFYVDCGQSTSIVLFGSDQDNGERTTTETVERKSALEGLLHAASSPPQPCLTHTALLSMEAVVHLSGVLHPCKWVLLDSRLEYEVCWEAFRRMVGLSVSPLVFHCSSDLRDEMWTQIVEPLLSHPLMSLSTHFGKLALRSLLEEMRSMPAVWKKKVTDASCTSVPEECSMKRLMDLAVIGALFCVANGCCLDEEPVTVESESSKEENLRKELVSKLPSKMSAAFTACIQRFIHGCWNVTSDVHSQERGLEAVRYLLGRIATLSLLSESDAAALSLGRVKQVLGTSILIPQVEASLKEFNAEQSTVLQKASRLKCVDAEDTLLSKWGMMLLRDETVSSSLKLGGIRELRWSDLKQGLSSIISRRAPPSSPGSDCTAVKDLFTPPELSIILRVLSRMRARLGVGMTFKPQADGHTSALAEMISTAITAERTMYTRSSGALSRGFPDGNEDSSLPLIEVEVVLKECAHHHMQSLPLPSQMDAVFVGLVPVTQLTRPTPSSNWPVDVTWNDFSCVVAGCVLMQSASFLTAHRDTAARSVGDSHVRQEDACTELLRETLHELTERVFARWAVKQQNSTQTEEAVSSSVQGGLGNDYSLHVVHCYTLMMYQHLLQPSGDAKAQGEFLSALYALTLLSATKALEKREHLFADELLWFISYVTQYTQSQLFQLAASVTSSANLATAKQWWWTAEPTPSDSVDGGDASAEEGEKELLAALPDLRSVRVEGTLVASGDAPKPTCSSGPSGEQVKGASAEWVPEVLSRCQQVTRKLWPTLWRRMLPDLKGQAEQCKVRGNIKIAMNLALSAGALRRCHAPFSLDDICPEAMLHRTAATHFQVQQSMLFDPVGTYKKLYASRSHTHQLAAIVTMMPESTRCSNLIAQQIKLVTDLCTTEEVLAFLVMLRDWGWKYHRLDYEYTSPSHPMEQSSEGPVFESLESGQRDSSQMRGTVTHNVSPPSYRMAWSTLCRRLCDRELLDTPAGSVCASSLGPLLSSALLTGAVLQCTDTKIFQRLLSFLVYDAMPPCLSINTLSTWNDMVDACGMANEEQQTYALLIRQKFIVLKEHDLFSVGCASVNEEFQLSPSRFTHLLCSFVEHLGVLCVGDAELWDCLSSVVEKQWIPAIRLTSTERPGSSCAKQEEDLAMSLTWARKTAGFA